MEGNMVQQDDDILRVEFKLTGMPAMDWNRSFPGHLPARIQPDHIQRAAEMAAVTMDMSLMRDLDSKRARRNREIAMHFQACADALIAEIEKREGWDTARDIMVGGRVGAE